MLGNSFVHLHTHTEYSLLDGSAKINHLLDRTLELGMDSLAITDHGVMFGAIDFYKKAKAIGVKPIIGCEVYVANTSRFVKESAKDNSHLYYHLVLLAENNEGYQNLMKLVSLGFTEGFYYKPRVDKEILAKYSSGLIALSACLAGSVPRSLLNEGYDKAVEEALSYLEIFGENNFFLELQDHGISEQKIVNTKLLQMSKDTGIPLVCTNDVHYILREDNVSHDILLCVQTGKTVNSENRMIYEGQEFYLKSAKEMTELFPYALSGIENTVKIAERCNVEIEFHNYKLPKYDLPNSKTSAEYLKEVCFLGLNNRYSEVTKELEERLLFEIDTIVTMGFSDYFLVVWDFIKFSRDNDIIVGPGRGSAAGSLVSYCLYITNIDPITYNLLFERFLNPERVSMPDIDIDFCVERRQEVIDYVIQKYGNDHVAQIVTFGTMAARGAIRDVGRALDYSYGEVDRIAKMVPTTLGITIKDALKVNIELKELYDNDERIKSLIDMSLKLEGLPRHSSVHAAGVVICDRPVMDYVPLNQSKEAITTQYTMNTLEELGLLKMDFLGLRNLTVIQKAVKEINRIHGISINIDEIPLDDASVYQLISQGHTEGVFQLESAGMTSFQKELSPTTFEDIIAGISLYRPGPMDFIPKYIRGKRNSNSVTYAHESLRDILEPTYGCIVYQEQVMQIVMKLAGYSLGRSDLVRRAMSKKKTDVMEQERHNFIYGIEKTDENSDEVVGCIKNGVPKEIAEQIFDEMNEFAKYAFNKSHAAAYAMVAYQTAYLKKHYPVEFMAALLSSVMGNTDKIKRYISDCKKMGINVLPPDINESFANFSVKDNNIRFAFSAIKNVSKTAIKNFILEREENGKFVNFTDFINRLKDGDANKSTLESLIMAGVFDVLGGRREQYMLFYQGLVNSKNHAKRHTIKGQISLFDNEPSVSDDLPDIPCWVNSYKLECEKEVTGIYLSGHPLDEFLPVIERYISNTSLDFVSEEESQENSPDVDINIGIKLNDGDKVMVGGLISMISVKMTKNNDEMAFVTLEDLYGQIEIVVFPTVYKVIKGMLADGEVMVVDGRISIRNERQPNVLANNIRFYKDLVGVKPKNVTSMWIKFDGDIDELLPILHKYKGDMPVKLYNPTTKVRTLLPDASWILNSSEAIKEITDFVGEGACVIK